MNRVSVAWLVLLLAALILPGPASAQTSVIDLKTDTPYTHKPGTQVDVYRFVALLGTRATLVVTVPGHAIVTLYTPEGEAMMTVEGSERISLEAVLPTSNAYVASVVRAAKDKPYKMLLVTQSPTLMQAFVAKAVGYGYLLDGKPAYQCWLDPGRKMKTATGDGEWTTTVVAADRSETSVGGSAMRAETYLVEHNGGLFAKDVSADGQSYERAVELEGPQFDPSQSPRWNGYLCSDAD